MEFILHKKCQDSSHLLIWTVTSCHVVDLRFHTAPGASPDPPRCSPCSRWLSDREREKKNPSMIDQSGLKICSNDFSGKDFNLVPAAGKTMSTTCQLSGNLKLFSNELKCQIKFFQ